MAQRALARLNALLKALESMPPEARQGGLWLALQALGDPQLIPYVSDPLLPLEGAFLSLDSQLLALQAARASLPANAGGLGTIWGALYLPAQQKARPCRVAVAALSAPTELGWPLPEPVAPVSPSVARSAAAALREALALIERVGMPPPRPVHLLYGVEEGLSAAGDSLGLPLFLATLSALTGLPLRPQLGATGALAEGALCAVNWTEAKRTALQAEGISLLSHSDVETLAEAATQALEGGEGFRYCVPSAVPPLVALPTFLVADVELSDLLGARDEIAAFERTVCAALERQGGFLYRRQAAVEEGIRAVFATPEAACAAGVAVQQALVRHPWAAGCAPLLARIGLYQGSAERVRDGYFGAAPGMAFRLMQAAHAGQILLPQELAAEVTLVTVALGIHRLRDLSMALNLCRLDAPEVPHCELSPRTLRVRNHNLPLEPNPLLGRAMELASIRAFLESGRRLVTLTGAGGIGKTRLALQVAAELADRFTDGVWFVSLADVHNEEQLDAAIAEALGLEIRDSRVRFIETLAERRMLLVLDNFETVLVAAPRVAQLLRQAPGLVCLVTSQALLSLTGEWRFEVAPLELVEAERLFIERALQVEHDLALTEADLSCIRRICQRLEGMPLAVELAAARRRLFSLEEIEARLDNALSLLVTRARDVPERQRRLCPYNGVNSSVA